MEYQNITNFLDDTTNQLSKFRARDWAEIKNGSRGTYNVSNQTKFKNLSCKVKFMSL